MENGAGELRELFREIAHVGEGNDTETWSAVGEVAEKGS